MKTLVFIALFFNALYASSPSASSLGLEESQYNFLYGLFGFFMGFLMFWLVPRK